MITDQIPPSCVTATRCLRSGVLAFGPTPCNVIGSIPRLIGWLYARWFLRSMGSGIAESFAWSFVWRFAWSSVWGFARFCARLLDGGGGSWGIGNDGTSSSKFFMKEKKKPKKSQLFRENHAQWWHKNCNHTLEYMELNPAITGGRVTEIHFAFNVW